MPLTLNQVLFLILTMAAVVAVAFVVRFLIQIRRTDLMVKEKLDDLGQTLEASKRVALNLSEVTAFLTTKLVRPVSRYWSVIFPVLGLFWRQMKKRKEK
jgi:hypothetical protein